MPWAVSCLVLSKAHKLRLLCLYMLSSEVLSIIQSHLNLGLPDVARLKLARRYNKVDEMEGGLSRTVTETFRNHYDTILNCFSNRSTNASAESFNAKEKAFRTQFRGVVDINLFMFRLARL